MALLLQKRKQRIVLQSRRVRLRLIQPGTGAGAVSVLGRSYVPSWDGVNGKRGFVEGTYERRLSEEAPAKLTIPNTTGSDGVLHRNRFLILTAVNYRPGDEWIEIWASSRRGTAGDLLYVGTPASFTINETDITLNLLDALWTLKKQRESTLGYVLGAPRDIFEDYTKVLGVVFADGLDTAATNFSSSISASYQISVDGKWTYRQAVPSPVTSFLRLIPTVSVSAVASSPIGLQVGTASSRPLDRWRAECSFIGPAMPSTSEALYLQIYHASPTCTLQINGGTPGQATLSAGAVSQTVSASYQAGQHTLTIEGRGRWVYFMFDGKLLAVLPMPAGSTTAASVLAILGSPAAADLSPAYYLDLDYMVLRQASGYLMRSTVDTGDIMLPGAPAAGGLQGSYFNDADLAADANMGSKQLGPLRSVPGGQGLYARRVDPAVAFGYNGATGSPWIPQGPPSSNNFSARWTGSVYLNLAGFDYTPVVRGEDGFRLWIGKTRFGEQILDTWQNGVPTRVAVPGVQGAPVRAALGNVTGWYPVILEYQVGGSTGSLGVATIQFGFHRSDSSFPITTASHLVPAGVGPYQNGVAAEPALAVYVPMNDSVLGVEALTGAKINATGGVVTTPSPVANDTTLKFDGSSGYHQIVAGGTNASIGNTTGFAGVTVEAWVNGFDGNALTNAIIAEKLNVFSLEINAAGNIVYAGGNGTAFSGTSASTGTIGAGAWNHLAVTHVPSTGALAFYINGAAAGTGSIGTGQTGGNTTNRLTLAARDTPVAFFNGAIAHVALYNQVLSAAAIAAHYSAISSASAAPLSPQGIVEQQVRNDSYYEQLVLLRDNYALQFTSRPMSLESGEFPGRMCPRVREGRDTDYILDHENTTSPEATGSTEDVADSIIVDAQGLADPTGSGQLYAEGFNFAELSSHLYPSSEYDSPGNISVYRQLVQRASSLLGLRSRAWLSVGMRPAGHRELTDSFPLTGALAEFAWQPGDGVRRQFPGIGVQDSSPVAINAVSWPVYPDGIGAPTVTLKSRIRSLRETLRRIQRESIDESRNYQGQFVVVPATLGANPAIASLPDTYSRVPLPTDLSTVISLTLVVMVFIAGSTATTIEVNGVNTNITVSVNGRYDILPFLARSGAADSRLYVRLLIGTGAVAEYIVELKVKT